jgi:nitrilase
MTHYANFKVAAVQAAPVYFDRDASTEKACRLLRDAGKQGAALAAFGESWLPGYPFFVWGQATAEMEAAYVANAVPIPSPTTDQLCQAARKAAIDVVIGVAELDPRTHGTVYATLLFISSAGEILGRHRKLKPTKRERTAWGEGDGSSLVTYERDYARISGLNCWEHNMVLPGYTLMDAGTQVHVAAWPGSATSRHLFLSQAFASQAAAYVIDVGAIAGPEHATERFRDAAPEYPGQSHIIDPRGEIIAGPAEGETILVADCSLEHVYSAKTYCDVAGHYSRPDIFQVHVNRNTHRRVVDTESSDSPPIA